MAGPFTLYCNGITCSDVSLKYAINEENGISPERLKMTNQAITQIHANILKIITLMNFMTIISHTIMELATTGTTTLLDCRYSTNKIFFYNSDITSDKIFLACVYYWFFESSSRYNKVSTIGSSQANFTLCKVVMSSYSIIT